MHRFLDSFKKYLTKEEGILWGIRKEKQLIGFVALMDLSTAPTIFFAIHPHFRNHGFAKESVAMVVDYFKSTSPLLKLQTEVHKDNKASLSVLRYCGFKTIGELNSKFALMLFVD